MAQSKYASFQLQELALEAIVEFCCFPEFAVEMFVNYDCDISCSNVLEDLSALLSKTAFPVNAPLSTTNKLALEGLLGIISNMAERSRAVRDKPLLPPTSLPELSEYRPFWEKQDLASNPKSQVKLSREQKYMKRRLLIGAEHFNRDPKKGIEFLKSVKLLPETPDAISIARFFRHSPGLDKVLVGDYLGDHDDFKIQVLHEFVKLFDFSEMTMDAALRSFLETFRLPGEAQKIARILECFAEWFYLQSPSILAGKDTAYVLAYSVIMLNTDQHSGKVKKKMTEEEFIRNNRNINDGNDLPREMLSKLYHSIVKNEIKVLTSSGSALHEMTYSRWMDLIRKSKTGVAQYIQMDAEPALDLDVFAILAGPTIAAISVVFEHTQDEELLRSCMNGFLGIAETCAFHCMGEILDDLVVSLCKFTTLLNPMASDKEPMVAFGENIKARLAAVTVFSIANKFGNFISSAWRNILDCILRLNKLGILPLKRISSPRSTESGDPPFTASPPAEGQQALRKKRSSGLFASWVSLGMDTESQPLTEEEIAAQQQTMKTIDECSVGTIFTASSSLKEEPIVQLAKAIVWAAGRPNRAGGGGSQEDEDTAVFCLDLLLLLIESNRERLLPLWPLLVAHLSAIVQSTFSPGLLIEKAVLGLLRLCQKMLPHNDEVSEEILRSLHLILKLDAKVADALCEKITKELLVLVQSNAGTMKSAVGWRTTCSLLAITARHPEAAEAGFEALEFIMSGGSTSHVVFVNFTPCLDAARDFAEARAGGFERSVAALGLLENLVDCLEHWSKLLEEKQSTFEENHAKAAQEDPAADAVLLKLLGTERHDKDSLSRRQQILADLWHRLLQAFRRICGDQREEVRNQAVVGLQRCILAAETLKIPTTLWGTCFDQIIFVLLDDVLDTALREKPKEFRGMEDTMQLAMKLLSKVFLHFLPQLSTLPAPTFRALWTGTLVRMETYVKARLKARTEKLQENIPELLRNMLMVMKANGVLSEDKSGEGDGFWDLTWRHVRAIAPKLRPEDITPSPLQPLQHESSELRTSDEAPSATSGLTSAVESTTTAHVDIAT